MLKIVKNWLVISLFCFIALFGTQTVLAQQAWQYHTAVQGNEGRCVGLQEGVTGSVANRNLSDIPTIQGVVCLIANGLSIVMTLLVMIGFVMVIYGGFIYMISGGQPQRLQKGIDTIKMVVAGIILALSSFIIINIIAQYTGVTALLSIDFNWQPRGNHSVSVPTPTSTPAPTPAPITPPIATPTPTTPPIPTPTPTLPPTPTPAPIPAECQQANPPLSCLPILNEDFPEFCLRAGIGDFASYLVCLAISYQLAESYCRHPTRRIRPNPPTWCLLMYEWLFVPYGCSQNRDNPSLICRPYWHWKCDLENYPAWCW